MIERVFLWKPTKIKGKWKWLCFVNRKQINKFICIEGKVLNMVSYEYLEVGE